MGLIKADHASVRVAPFSMRDIEKQARGMLVRAEQQAEQLLAEAQGEAERLKAEARAQGMAEGLAQGRADGLEAGREMGRAAAMEAHRAELAQLARALAAAAGEIEASRRVLSAAALRDVVELSIAIARRVTKRQAAIDPEVLRANVAESLKLVLRAADVRIAVNPAQRSVLESVLPQLQVEWPDLKHVEIVGDETVLAGGCRVHTRDGVVDGDLETQLDRVVGELVPGGRPEQSEGSSVAEILRLRDASRRSAQDDMGADASRRSAQDDTGDGGDGAGRLSGGEVDR
jgi:flagellar assembly protein FliH